MKTTPEKDEKSEVEALAQTLAEWRRSSLWTPIFVSVVLVIETFFSGEWTVSFTQWALIIICPLVLAKVSGRLSRVLPEIRLNLMAINYKAEKAQLDLEELKAKLHE